MNLLLHVCCGPCSLTVAEGFERYGWRVTGLYYNPNIHPYSEYRLRLESLRALWATYPDRTLVVSSEYDLEGFLRRVAPCPALRCAECYQMRLSEAASAAREGGFDAFSSTLLVSPYQDHEVLRGIGEAAGETVGIPFLYEDFRPSFRRGQDEARARGLYRQKYCGCVYSEMERYLRRKAQ